MLWYFLYVQALLLAICDYLFIAPEHLIGQKDVCEREMFIMEQPTLGAGRRKTRKLVAPWVSRQEAELARVRSELVLFWALSWKPFSKEREDLATGELQSCPSSRGKHRAALGGGRTVRLGVCHSKVIFSLAAWGMLFLPFSPSWGDAEPSCGLCTAFESGLSHLHRASPTPSPFFFFFNPLPLKFFDNKKVTFNWPKMSVLPNAITAFGPFWCNLQGPMCTCWLMYETLCGTWSNF